MTAALPFGGGLSASVLYGLLLRLGYPCRHPVSGIFPNDGSLRVDCNSMLVINPTEVTCFPFSIHLSGS